MQICHCRRKEPVVFGGGQRLFSENPMYVIYPDRNVGYYTYSICKFVRLNEITPLLFVEVKGMIFRGRKFGHISYLMFLLLDQFNVQLLMLRHDTYQSTYIRFIQFLIMKSSGPQYICAFCLVLLYVLT